VLSAIGLPVLPPAGAPLPVVPSAVYQISGSQFARTMAESALQSLATAPQASSLLSIDQPAISGRFVSYRNILTVDYVGNETLTSSLVDSETTSNAATSVYGTLAQASASDRLISSPGSVSDGIGSTTIVIQAIRFVPRDKFANEYELSAYLTAYSYSLMSPPDPGLAPPSSISDVQPALATLPPSPVPPGSSSTGPVSAISQLPASATSSSDSNEVSPSLGSSSASAKGYLTATSVATTGNQTSMAEGDLLPSSNGTANSPATGGVFSTATISSAAEGGFITLDDAPANKSQLTSGSLHTMAAQGVGSDEVAGTWLTSVLPSALMPADSTRQGSKTVPSSDGYAATVASRTVVDLRPLGEANEGGSIELTIAMPNAAVPDNERLPIPETSADTTLQLAEIRSESGAGLFCDIEVSVAPALSADGSPTAAIFYRDAGPSVVGATVHGPKADAVKEPARPKIDSAQGTRAGLTDNLPWILGAAVLASHHGSWLEERVPQRERRLHSIEDMRRTSR
jgi:hypothetical protein